MKKQLGGMRPSSLSPRLGAAACTMWLALACGGSAKDVSEAGGITRVRPADEPSRALEVPPEAAGPSSPPPASNEVAYSIPVTSPPPAEAPAPAPAPATDDWGPRPSTPAPEVLVPASGSCRYEYLGDWVRCEHSEWPNFVDSAATDLAGCVEECQARDDCTAVTDWRWLGLPDLGCALYISTCSEPTSPVYAEEDGAREYVKTCP